MSSFFITGVLSQNSPPTLYCVDLSPGFEQLCSDCLFGEMSHDEEDIAQ